MTQYKPLTMMIIEDDPGHVRLIEKNLRRAGIGNDIIKAGDGQEALDILFEEGAHEGRKRPSPILVLLDLNMPVLDGYEVIKRLKASPNTQRIPIIVLTTTDDQREMERCYDLGCNLYITKPVEYDKFVEAIQQLGMFLTIMSVPDGNKE